MNIESTAFDGVLLITPDVFSDHRGSLFESWHDDRYAAARIPDTFVQDNTTTSERGVLRGLHLQRAPHAQGKLITVAYGAVADVVVDLRTDSATFGRALMFELSEHNRRQLWIPEGLAHGFQVITDRAIVHYKCTKHRVASHEAAIRWNDPDLAIEWPITAPILSERDATAPSLSEFAAYRPPPTR
jgi:dTDP-4-dehydrorhamnose 3,5-epimerase